MISFELFELAQTGKQASKQASKQLCGHHMSGLWALFVQFL